MGKNASQSHRGLEFSSQHQVPHNHLQLLGQGSSILSLPPQALHSRALSSTQTHPQNQKLIFLKDCSHPDNFLTENLREMNPLENCNNNNKKKLLYTFIQLHKIVENRSPCCVLDGRAKGRRKGRTGRCLWCPLKDRQ